MKTNFVRISVIGETVQRLNKKFSVSRALFLCLVGAAGSMHAAPILYTFNFTGGTVNPTGSFEFDASINQFENVTITWEGVEFSPLAANFNAQTATVFCAGQVGELGEFDILTQGACGGGTWSGDNVNGNYTRLGVILAGPFVVLDFISNGNPFPSLSTSGTVSASAAADTPEPGAMTLVAAGLSGLCFVHRRISRGRVRVSAARS